MEVSDSGVFVSLLKYPAVKILLFFLPGTISGPILAHHLGNEVVFGVSAATIISGIGMVFGSLRSARSRSTLLLLILSVACFTNSYLSSCTVSPGDSPPGVYCEDRLFLIGECLQVVPGESSEGTSRIRLLIRGALHTDENRTSANGFLNRKAFLTLSGPFFDFRGQTLAVVARFLGWKRYQNSFSEGSPVPVRPGAIPRFKAHVRDCFILSPASPGGRRRISPEALKRKCSDNLGRWLDPVPSCFLRAVLLGERESLPYEKKDVLRRAGTYHILAISGVHIGLLAMILLAVTGAVGVPRKHSIRICVLLLFGYIVLIGGSTSSIRAFIMVTIFLSAFLHQRYRSSVNSLAVAAVVILSLYPAEMTGPGFLLSFTAVTGILISTSRGRDTNSVPGGRLANLQRSIMKGIRISLSAFLAQMPVMVFFFGTLYQVSVVSNLVILPLFGLSLALGLSFLLLSFVSANSAILLAPVVEGSVSLLFRAAELFGRTPPVNVPAYQMSIVVTVALTGLLLLSALTGRQRALYSICFLVMLQLLLRIPFLSIGVHRDGVRIAFLDVGEGDCCVIESGRNRVVIVDTGDTGYETVESQISEYLAARGVRKVDLLILTHPHDDHFGDAEEILKRYTVSHIIGIEPQWESASYAGLLRIIRQRRIPYFPALRGDTVRFESSCFAFLGPGRSPLEECLPSENDHSLVMKLTLCGLSILFSGDAESCAEGDMVERYGRLLESDVLKTGHHGSRTSTTEAFLEEVNPELAVISCDRAGKFDHPSPEIVDRFGERGITVYRTDIHGGILLEYEQGGEIRITTSYQ